jgi:hypothetical protein
MPRLLSGSTLRKGGSGEFINLKTAQPQLPPTETTSTGYSLVTNDKLQTAYRSSLGNIEMRYGKMWSNLPNQNINIIGTGTSTLVVSGGTINVDTGTGALVVEGGVGIYDGLWTGEDIHVNGLTIGQGYEGLNNIVIRGDAAAQVSLFDDGQENIVIGYDALNGLTTGYKNIAIGRYALSSGTYLSNAIAIGDSALKDLGIAQTELAASITGITLGTITEVTAPSHGLTTGTRITFAGIVGTTELNGNVYYVGTPTTNTFTVFSDVNVNNPLDSSAFTAYVSDGTVELPYDYDHNIAVGSDSGKRIKNGQQNLLLGHNAAVNLTTGSYNILIGHMVANNMTTGTANISIGGDNLVDGLDNQISIGSAYYFNGDGYSQFNSDLGLGLGTEATATYFLTVITGASQTNPVVIDIGGTTDVSSGTQVVITNVGGMVELNEQIYFASYINTTSFAIYYDENLTVPVDGTGFTAYTSGGDVLALEPHGALSILGGVGVFGNLITTGEVDVYSGMRVRHLITGTITSATNLTGGALGSIPYQLSPGQTDFVGIGPATYILRSDGTTPVWDNMSTLAAGTSTNSDNVFVNAVTPEVTYYLGLTEIVGDYSPVDGDNGFTYVTTLISTSTYFVTGTNTLNVPGSVYAMEGHPSENYLLYTPRVHIGTSPPVNPRVGDFWIDNSIGVEFQYVDDGGNKIWIQFTSI